MFGVKVNAISLTAILLTIGVVPAAMAEERACNIAEAKGGATIYRADGSLPGTAGTELESEDRLVTDADARILIACDDGTEVTIGPETEINLGTLIGPTDRSRDVTMDIDRGIARFLAPLRSWRNFEVSAPTAVASVRSTEWVMLSQEGTSSVFVIDGLVAVDASGVGGAVLPPGRGIDVGPDGRIVKVGIWGAKRVAQVKETLGLE